MFTNTKDSPAPSTHYSIHDANLALYQCLSTATPTRPALPPEIVLQILEHPTRWVCSYSTAFPDPDAIENSLIRVRAGFDSSKPDIQVILSTRPLSKEHVAKARSVIFTFTGKDQGWSSYPLDCGTYENSWTWFEAGLRPQTSGDYDPIERGDGFDEQDQREEYRYERFHLQRNRHGGGEPESYRIELRQDHPLLKNMKSGDVIDLLACAQFSGWVNHVDQASIEICSFDDLNEDEIHGENQDVVTKETTRRLPA
ncbi:MAG: hypothetical protein Q9217_006964 [Psora testacea]